jgi:hypothetical protein
MIRLGSGVGVSSSDGLVVTAREAVGTREGEIVGLGLAGPDVQALNPAMISIASRNPGLEMNMKRLALFKQNPPELSMGC